MPTLQKPSNFTPSLMPRIRFLPAPNRILLIKYNAPNTWAALGRCYALLGDLQQAEECFNMCAKENPRDFETRLNLAEILEKTNRKDGALEMVEAGSYLAPLGKYLVIDFVFGSPPRKI